MVHAFAVLPWVVLLAGVGYRAVETELEDAAILDLPAWRVALQVTLRRSVGALAGASLGLALIVSGDMTVTDLLQVRTYAEEAYIQYQIGQGPAATASVTLPPLVVLGTLSIVLARCVLGVEPARLVTMIASSRLWRLGPYRLPVGVIVGSLVACLAGLPLVSLTWWAGRLGGLAAPGRAPHWSLASLVANLNAAAGDAAGPLANSLVTSALGATSTVVLAWTMAWFSRSPGPWRAGLWRGSPPSACPRPDRSRAWPWC